MFGAVRCKKTDQGNTVSGENEYAKFRYQSRMVNEVIL